jgi:hypothetical protein
MEKIFENTKEGHQNAPIREGQTILWSNENVQKDKQ